MEKTIGRETQVQRVAAALLELPESERRPAIRPLLALIDRMVSEGPVSCREEDGLADRDRGLSAFSRGRGKLPRSGG
jgi:hypothetical protein